jgi:hypothetical protein
VVVLFAVSFLIDSLLNDVEKVFVAGKWLQLRLDFYFGTLLGTLLLLCFDRCLLRLVC